MKQKVNIALVGARGVGKSKLSRRLKKLSNRPVMSTDILVSYENKGLSISELVSALGWAGFRQLEHKVLKKVAKMQNIIIDCGGGILFDVEIEKKPRDGNSLVETYSKAKAKLLKKRSHVIFLKQNENSLLQKNFNGADRPELSSDYETLARNRFPYYEKVADFTIDMEKHSIEEAAKLVFEKYLRFMPLEINQEA